MTFYDFVISFEEDNTPLGFLAHNIIGDKTFQNKRLVTMNCMLILS